MGRFRIAIDTGGTFTDVVCLDTESGEITTLKEPSTPEMPDEAVIRGIRRLELPMEEVSFLGYGMTVAINTLVQRVGARTGLITTRGFRDVLEIQRTNRPDMYNLFFRKPVPLVPRNLRLEVSERVLADGSVLRPLDLEELAGAVDQLVAAGVEAIAISFLNAYANPVHEREAVAYVRERYPDLPVTASHEVVQEWREFERTSTAVVNAYLLPNVQQYLNRLRERVWDTGYQRTLYIMKSDGGLSPAGDASDYPVTLLQSGPAAGVLGAAKYGLAIGMPNLITFDIGGTTCDVSLIRDGVPTYGRDQLVEGYPVLTPFIDIHSIGAGGGTVAWADAAGMLRMGPRSAGARPGPACYDRGGTDPTVTDFYVLCNLVDPDRFLGGAMRLRRDLAQQATEKLARRVGMSVEQCARGGLTILDHHMVAALRVVSVERGHDPRDFTLMAFGGAGALHIGTLGRELGVRQGLVPVHPSLFSAWGILTADVRYSFAQTINRPVSDLDPAELNALLAQLVAMGRERLDSERLPEERVRLVASVEMRYEGQEHTINVPVPIRMDDAALADMVERFHQAHEQAYTFHLRGEPCAITTIRVDAIGMLHDTRLPGWPVRGGAEQAFLGTRKVLLDLAEGYVGVPIYDRLKLGVDATLEGPCIVEEPTSATVLLPGQRLRVDEFGNLICQLN